jgi:GT2 family glycosyltransferase
MQGNFNIIIVDNCSRLENYELIKKKYGKNKKIKILRTEKNLGFSKGNNFGFEYARKNFNPDFYYFISNDTLLTNKDTMKVIEEEYKRSKFDVFGSDIMEPDGKHVSPIRSNVGNSRYKVMARFYLLFIAQLLGVRHFLFRLKHIFTKKQSSKLDHTERKENVAFQGAAILFSKKCFKKLPKPFYPETFLYSEEDILSYNRIKYNLKTVYNPKVRIIHKESVTINKINKNKLKSMVFKLRHNLRSLKIFYDYMERGKVPE